MATPYPAFQQFLMKRNTMPATTLQGLIDGMKLAQLAPLRLPPIAPTPQPSIDTSALGMLSAGGPLAETEEDRNLAAESEEEGILDKAFGMLDAPQNFITNTFEQFTTDNEGGNWLSELGSDLWETTKAGLATAHQLSPTTLVDELIPNQWGGDTLDEIAKKANPPNSVNEQLQRLDYFKDHKTTAAILGFGGDILTDPLTYVGPGLAKTVGKLFKTGIPEVAERATIERAGMEAQEELLTRAAKGTAPNPKPTPRETIEDVTLNVATPNAPIRSRSFREHMEEGAPRLLGADAAKYTTPEADDMITTALGAKYGEEVRFLADEAASKKVPAASAPVTLEAAKQAVDSADELSPLIAQGVPRASESIQGKIFYDHFVGAAERNLTPKGNPRYGKIYEDAWARLRAGEDAIVEMNKKVPFGIKGHTPLTFAGIPMRLSDVLLRLPKPKNEKGIKEMNDVVTQFMKGEVTPDLHPAIMQSVREHQAAGIISRPGLMPKVQRYMKKEHDRLVLKGEDPAQIDTVPIMRKALKKAVREQAMKKVGDTPGLPIRAANEVADAVVRHVTDTPVSKMDKLYQKSAEASQAGKVHHPTVEADTRHVEAGVGGKLKDKHDDKGFQKDVSASLMIRSGSWMQRTFTTWHNTYGIERQFKSEMMNAAQAANMRAEKARRELKNFTKEARQESLARIQGLVPENAPWANPGAEMAYAHMKDWTNAIFGDSTFGLMGLAQKSNVLMKDINKGLDTFWGKKTGKYRFRNDSWTDKATGRKWDFTGGPGSDGTWHDSWKAWDIDDTIFKTRIGDPTYMLYDLDTVVERHAKIHSAMADFGARFGRKVPSDEFQFQVMKNGKPHPMLDDLYFPQQYKEGMENLLEFIEKGNFVPSSDFGKHYAKALRAWKSAVTIYHPSHHIRNFIGDMWFTWMAGHNNIVDFYRGVKTMRAFRHQYKGLIKEGSWEDINKFARGQFDAGPTSTIFTHNGQKYSANDIYQGAFKRGLLMKYTDLEDLQDEGIGADFFDKAASKSPFKGRVRQGAQKVAENREHTIRLHHFIAATRKNLKKGMKQEEAMDKAAFEVRKWHPDGSDLTYREQQLRMIIPFYSWTRKAIPLIAEGFMTRPGKIVAYPRAMMAIGQATGVQTDPSGDLTDPFPDHSMYASWLRAGGIGPIGLYGGRGLSGRIGGLGEEGWSESGRTAFGTTIIDPGNPFNDLTSELFGLGGVGGLKEGLMGTLGPPIRIPMEVLQQKMFGTGQEIGGGPSEVPWWEYATKQLPQADLANRLFPVTGSHAEKYGMGTPNHEGLINWFTALGVVGSGQYQKNAEFEAKERAAKAKREAMGG